MYPITNQRDGPHPRGTVLIAGTVVLLVAIAVAVGWAQSPGRFEGTLASVNDSILILDVEGIGHTFRWDHETIATLNGEVVEVIELRAGDGARVAFHREEDGVMVARSVEATRATN
jgi:hypothetical protein